MLSLVCHLNTVRAGVLPHVAKGVCTLHCGKMLDKCFEILRRTTILHIRKEVHASSISPKNTVSCGDPTDKLLDDIMKYFD
jgi:hypothetical protein